MTRQRFVGASVELRGNTVNRGGDEVMKSRDVLRRSAIGHSECLLTFEIPLIVGRPPPFEDGQFMGGPVGTVGVALLLLHGGEHASGDGFLFALTSGYNIVKDSEAIDCARWGFVYTEGTRHSMLVDCRGGDVHIRSFGFVDVVEGPGTILVRCRSPNSLLEVNSDSQEVVGCMGATLNAKHSSFPRLLGNTIIGGALKVSEVRDDQLLTPGEESPMLGFNRVFLSDPSPDMTLSVLSSDGLGTAAYNVLYGYEDDAHRSTEMLLFGVGARQGNLQAWGQWQEPLGQYARPYYLRAHMDFDFKKRFRGPSDKPQR